MPEFVTYKGIMPQVIDSYLSGQQVRQNEATIAAEELRRRREEEAYARKEQSRQILSGPGTWDEKAKGLLPIDPEAAQYALTMQDREKKAADEKAQREAAGKWVGAMSRAPEPQTVSSVMMRSDIPGAALSRPNPIESRPDLTVGPTAPSGVLPGGAPSYVPQTFGGYGAKAKLNPADEFAFRWWYREQAQKNGLDPNPDSPEHQYDYRAAWKAKEGAGGNGHWPSDFKTDTHPNRFPSELGGMVDSRNGQPVATMLPPTVAFTPRGLIRAAGESYQKTLEDYGGMAGLQELVASGGMTPENAFKIIDDAKKDAQERQEALDKRATSLLPTTAYEKVGNDLLSVTGTAGGIPTVRKLYHGETEPKEPGSVAPGNYIRDPEAPGGYRQLGTPPSLEKPAGTVPPGNYVPDASAPGGYRQVGTPPTLEKPTAVPPGSYVPDGNGGYRQIGTPTPLLNEPKEKPIDKGITAYLDQAETMAKAEEKRLGFQYDAENPDLSPDQRRKVNIWAETPGGRAGWVSRRAEELRAADRNRTGIPALVPRKSAAPRPASPAKPTTGGARIAPAGTKAKGPDGTYLTSDGKGGWR